MGNEYPMTNIGAVIMARDQSTRCPGKALADIMGEPALYRMVERVRVANYIMDVVIATSEDSPRIVDFCQKYGIHCTIGDINDTLSRTYKSALEHNIGTVVRLWGDSILIDPYVVNDVINHHLGYGADYTYNIGFPKGLNCHVLDFNMLKELHETLTEPIDRMFWARWVMKNKNSIAYSNYKPLDSVSFCVDYPDDLEFTRHVFEKQNGKIFRWEEVLPLWLEWHEK